MTRVKKENRLQGLFPAAACRRALSSGDRYWFLSWVLVCLLIASGSCTSPRLRPLSAVAVSPTLARLVTPPLKDEQLQAVVDAPLGWKADPPKITSNHRHKAWLSPTGDTAYGVINFDMPLPVGPDTALWAFLRQMKRTEGDANLLSKQADENLPGIRFVVEGGLYTIRCNLVVDGFHGWVVYAGSLRSRPMNVKEIRVAEFARDQTEVDVP